jgi:hypothetical protein
MEEKMTTARARAAVVALIALVLMLLGAGAASAAPIVCPGGQVATQVAPGQFACVNHGGNADNSGKTKNPND